jgi:hypothetical protein
LLALFHRDRRAAGRKLSGVKPPKFGVLYGWTRAAESIMIAWEYLVPNRGLPY